MDPISAVKGGSELAKNFGLGVVLAIIAIGILAWVIWYSFTQNTKREERMAKEAREREDKLVGIIQAQGVALRDLTTSINNLNNRIENAQAEHQNRHQSLLVANQKCREENEAILRKIDKLDDKLDNKECKAK